MILQEKTISQNELFEVSAHEHYYVNPYFGCSEKCPYCYWTSVPGWEGQITARVNIVEVFAERMRSWDKTKRICFGSYCNPYEFLERDYRLTRGLLQVCKEQRIHFLLTTSSSLIAEDIDLIASMKEQAVIVFELSRIDRLVRFEKAGFHDVIEAANAFHKRGIKVLATLSPYLKGITDANQILKELSPGIPLYIGSLDLQTNWTTAGRLLPEIYRYKPELLDHYGWVIQGNHAETEFEAYMQQFAFNHRVKRFPLDIQYENCVDLTSDDPVTPRMPHKRYSGEFKQKVVEAIVQNKLSYRQAAKLFGVSSGNRVSSWHKIYLSEGVEGLYVERRGKWQKK